MLRKLLICFLHDMGGKMPLDSYEICCGEMPLVVMKYVGEYGNKNVKMIFT